MDRSENLRSIIQMLLDERMEYADWQIPDSLPEQQMMMRSLLNVRPPRPVDDDFLKAQEFQLKRDIEGYKKTTQDDLISMQTGLFGYKMKLESWLVIKILA